MNPEYVATMKAGSVQKYAADAECPRIAIPLANGGYRYHEMQLHDWRCLSTPEGLLWYCTRCQKISTKQPRRPRKKKAAPRQPNEAHPSAACGKAPANHTLGALLTETPTEPAPEPDPQPDEPDTDDGDDDGDE